MEREAAYDLFKCFLEKRGLGKELDLSKGLMTLLEYAKEVGCFQDPNDVFDLPEWKKFGDELWTRVIDDNKQAKKLAKDWRTVINCLRKYAAEHKVAAAAQEKLSTFSSSAHPPSINRYQVGKEDIPEPPSASRYTFNERRTVHTSSGVPW